MSTDNLNSNEANFDTVEERLASKLKDLQIKQEKENFYSVPILSLNEYYYEVLNFDQRIIGFASICGTETIDSVASAVESPSLKKKSKRDKSRKKKKQEKEERMIEKIETMAGKLKNITVTINNDQFHASSSSSSSELKNSCNNKESKQLRLLQSGKMSSELIVKNQKNPLKVPTNIKGKENKLMDSKVEMNSVDSTNMRAKLKRIDMETSNMKSKVRKIDYEKKNREEIDELNRKIQAKIANQIKPRLKEIVSGKSNSKNGFIDTRRVKTNSESSQNFQLPKFLLSAVDYRSNNDASSIIPTTKVTPPSTTIEVEIQRYTFEQLYQLQKFSTWEMVPKLLKLKICRTQLSPLNDFLMTLMHLSDCERNEAILNKAAEKGFIKRQGLNNYTFLELKFAEEGEKFSKVDENLPRVKEDVRKMKLKPSPEYTIDRFRLIAKNDEELNDLIYQHEFINLFESALKDQDLNDQSHSNIVSHLIESNQAYIIEGEIRVNQRNNQEAYVSHRKGMTDVCVSKLILRKQAFHGDLVRVLVKRDSGNDEDLLNANNNQLTEQQQQDQSPNLLDDDDLNEAIQLDNNRNFGCVLEILERRHSRRVIGTFAPFFNIKKNRKHLMINVRDTKVPNVRVCTRTGIPTNVELNDKLLLTVEITNWSYDQPQGNIISVIGKKGQLKTENVAILQQNNLDPMPFEQNILDQLPEDPFVIPAREFEYREDLRKKCIFSIDPETARDLDDALSCEILPNGNLEIGVHISDVSYFVKESSDLDEIVKEKATSIYLVDTVYHMLPEKLCLMCSLLPGADKLAYSVFFEMNPNTAEIYNTRYTRSIVNSCAKLSYDHAQMVIEKKDQNWIELENEFPEILNGFTVTQVADVISQLQKVAIILRTNRKVNGALKIDQPKLSFKFAKDDQRMDEPVDYFKYCTKDSNRLIEEFMILANISVASFIHENYPDVALLRNHDMPNENAIKKLVKVLNKHNVVLDTSSSAALSKSMENLIAFAKNPNGMNAAINLLVSKTMTRAKYFCSHFTESSQEFWHYALSIPIYTHFTSPIRRYADILVHRVLNAALQYEEMPSRTPEEVQVLANICNNQKYNAKLAGEDSSNLYLMHFIQSLSTKTMSAGVLGIFDYNLEVILIDTGHVVKVYYKNLQQSDDIIIKTFVDNTPPYVTFYLPKLQSSMKIEFGMEILVQVEVVKEKLVVNKIFYNQK